MRTTFAVGPSFIPIRVLGLTIVLAVGSACEQAKDPAPSVQGAGTEAKSGDLPRPDFSVKADTKNALFTWVGKDGAFQITDVPEAVPDEARKTVRVVLEGHSPGGPDHVYVVDLTKLASGGELPVRTISRTEWEVLGKRERDARVAKLAPPDQPKDPSPADIGVDAIVYGADWCKPCHMAEDYLKKKGARVVKKDIEEDESAAAEMRRKLTRAGMGGSSIPILDVGGTMLKGFSESAIDAALKQKKSP